MTRPLRVGVVGLGVMGRRHARALAGLSGLEYAGAADHGAPRQELGRPVVAGLDDLLVLGVDACVVATPTPDHLPTALALAEAGVPALIEKPLGLDAAECARIGAAFAEAGVPAAVGHVERFHTAVRDLRATLLLGDSGPVLGVETRREGGPPRRRDGGVLLDLGTHDVDLTRWLTGLRHERVTAHSTDDVPGTDSAEVVATLTGGARAVHRVSWRAPRPARRIEVHCRGGSLVADTTEPGPEPPVPAQLRAFTDLVLGRVDPDDVRGCASLADGAYAVEIAVLAADALV